MPLGSSLSNANSINWMSPGATVMTRSVKEKVPFTQVTLPCRIEASNGFFLVVFVGLTAIVLATVAFDYVLLSCSLRVAVTLAGVNLASSSFVINLMYARAVFSFAMSIVVFVILSLPSSYTIIFSAMDIFIFCPDGIYRYSDNGFSLVPNFALISAMYCLAAALSMLSEALYLTNREPPTAALLVKLNDTVLAYEETPLLMTPGVLFVIVTPLSPLSSSSMTVYLALLKDMAPPWIAA